MQPLFMPPKYLKICLNYSCPPTSVWDCQNKILINKTEIVKTGDGKVVIGNLKTVLLILITIVYSFHGFGHAVYMCIPPIGDKIDIVMSSVSHSKYYKKVKVVFI